MISNRSTEQATDSFVRVSLSFIPALDYCAEALRRRRIRRSYGLMSDTQLRDIGLTRWDLEVALSLPLHQSASHALAKAAACEAAKW
ncbi:MAG TPA: hypothetical protein PKA03_00410 [Tabrizicola sp.]|nr:hypothetical protein [Tabrizicola sp.]HMS93689.1 hypothetical protein [Tabrizicola sp.]